MINSISVFSRKCIYYLQNHILFKTENLRYTLIHNYHIEGDDILVHKIMKCLKYFIQCLSRKVETSLNGACSK